MSTKYKKPPTNTFRVNATTLTQHITSPDYLRSIIDPNAQYQVIPSIPQTLSWGIDQLIDVAIELSRYKCFYLGIRSWMWRFLSENLRRTVLPNITLGGTSSSTAN